MDLNGNIFVGINNLYSIDYEGKIIWEKDFSIISSEIMVDNSNKIMFTQHNGFDGILKGIIQLDDKGNIINELPLNVFSIAQYFSPAISYGSILMLYSYNNGAVFIK